VPDGAGARPGGQRAVIEAARELCAAGRAFALTLVVEAEGSTYRKPGALALVADDGRRVGVISGGCLEPGLVELARAALATREPRDTVFDTRSDDDLLFGSGSGCRGRMRVVALPVLPDAPSPVLDAVLRVHDARCPARLALDVLASRLGLRAEVTLRPPPLVLLLGAGPEAPPLLDVARTLGWYVWVADHRTGLLEEPRLQAADGLIAAYPEAALAGLGEASPDAAIAMTHTAQHDLAALQALAVREVRYVGLLGPPARRDELLARLSPAGRAALAGRLHAPVGLPLGGEGPEAIALAIAAQMQSAFQRNA
jgi:xanthine dehydrogenase accessory factor